MECVGLIKMKINEILAEALPGTDAQSRIGKAISGWMNKRTVNKAVNDAYKFWIDHVEKLNGVGNYNLSDINQYKAEFERWMGRRLGLPPGHKILYDMAEKLNAISPDGRNGQAVIKSAMTDAVIQTQQSPDRGNIRGKRTPNEVQELYKKIQGPLISELQQMFSSNGLDQNNPKHKKTIDAVSKKTYEAVTAALMTNLTLRDPAAIVTKAVDYAKRQLATTPTSTPAGPAGQNNKTVRTTNLGNWTWNGTDWINDAGRAAGSGLIKILDQEAVKQGIVK